MVSAKAVRNGQRLASPTALRVGDEDLLLHRDVAEKPLPETPVRLHVDQMPAVGLAEKIFKTYVVAMQELVQQASHPLLQDDELS